VFNSSARVEGLEEPVEPGQVLIPFHNSWASISRSASYATNMKSSFAGYYPPTPDEYERLWREATIVLDTNVLLHLYRLPTSARDESLTVLELLRDRLWIPYQVALEFQIRRLTVIAGERKSTEIALTSAQAVVGEIRKKVDALQIEKRGLGIDTKPILEDLARANEKLVAAIEAAHQSQVDIASRDPVRERLDVLLDSRVGPGPKSQDELNELIKQGDDRYRDYIPPGFADADKEKNNEDATYVHDHLRYQRKFGDLILWRQILRQARSSSIKCLLFVTEDQKKDWWWREQNKTIGAHPELVSEIRREGGVDLFWMYSFVQFIEHANKYTAAAVSTQAVHEIQQVSIIPRNDPPIHSRDDPHNIASLEVNPRIGRNPFDPFDGENLRHVTERVADWLSSRYVNVLVNAHGFPDLLVTAGTGVRGYEVKYLRSLERMLHSSSVIGGMMRGYIEVNEGRLASFAIVIVICEGDYIGVRNANRVEVLNRRLEKLLARYPIDLIIVGAIVDGSFEVLTEAASSRPVDRTDEA
jgi:hypothetical protein